MKNKLLISSHRSLVSIVSTVLLHDEETLFLVPQDRYAVEMAGPDYTVTKEFIVKLMPVS